MVKSNPRHILFLSRWYPNRLDPMPGLFVKKHAEAAALYNDVALVHAFPMDLKNGKHFEIDRKKEDGFDSLVIYYKSVRCIIPGVADLIKGWRLMRYSCKGINILHKEGFKTDIIHLNILTRLGLIALWMKIRYGTPYIITEHWSRYLPITNTYHGLLRKAITKIVVRNAAITTVVTHNLRKAMQAHGLKSNYKIIHNVVDTELFQINEKKEDTFTFVHVSCFEDRSKNISGMLEAVAALSRQRQDFRIMMIGEGEDLDAMKSKTQVLKLDQIVRFYGLLENKKLSRTMSSGHCLLMFSNYENIPVVINESFACGIPVIATEVGGIPEHVDKQKGILVKAGDKKALSGAMSHMIDHWSDFHPKKLRDYALKKSSMQAVAKNLDQLYTEATSKK